MFATNSLKEQSVAKEDRGEGKLCGRKTTSRPDTQTANLTPGRMVCVDGCNELSEGAKRCKGGSRGKQVVRQEDKIKA